MATNKGFCLLALAAACVFPQILQASPLSHGRTFLPRSELQLLPRIVDPADCRLWATTNVWTTCQAFITQYNVSLPDFYAMNPSVEYDCYSFQPGTSYCLRMRKFYLSTKQARRQAKISRQLQVILSRRMDSVEDKHQ